MRHIVEGVKNFLLYLLYMIPGLIGTSLVIFIHELGHFIVARLLGVNVEVLSFGFGKTVFSHMGKKTEFRISLIPFGGYCRLGGAEDLTIALRHNEKRIEHAEEGSLFAISPFKKFLIYIAGPLMNLLLAIVLFFIVAIIPVERVSNAPLISPISEYPSLFSASIEQDEIRKGDLVLKLDGSDVVDYENLSQILSKKNGKDATLTILRDGSIFDVRISPVLYNGSYSYGITNLKEPIIGRSESPDFNVGDRIIECNCKKIEYDLDLLSIKSDEYTLTLLSPNGIEKKITLKTNSFPFAFKSNLIKSSDSSHPLSLSFERTKTIFVKTVRALSKLLSFQLKEALKEISGPFSSASNLGRISVLAFSSSSSNGFRTLLYLLAIVSVSICVGNLIPIPTFDGGQMLISLCEMICHKTFRPKTYLFLHIFGLIFAWGIVILMNSWTLISKLI